MPLEAAEQGCKLNLGKKVEQTLLFYKGLLILQAIIKPLADDEKNIPAFSEKKKK
ncbi:hypothetical protein [Pontibacter rugosus]|uniref:Uncharacterized protein n=1 Tax=Pontibacter rugosus TaxID=1745966 RepID=A0ABW3SQ87_9BACT